MFFCDDLAALWACWPKAQSDWNGPIWSRIAGGVGGRELEPPAYPIGLLIQKLPQKRPRVPPFGDELGKYLHEPM